jgi:hypothetical protein
MTLYDVEIRDADDDDAYLATIEGIEARDRESAIADPQVWQYVRQVRDDYPNAMPARVIAR